MRAENRIDVDNSLADRPGEEGRQRCPGPVRGVGPALFRDLAEAGRDGAFPDVMDRDTFEGRPMLGQMCGDLLIAARLEAFLLTSEKLEL